MPFLRGFYHLVWTTKNRESSIDDEREMLLARSIRATCDDKSWTLHAFGIMPDHIHIAMLFSGKYSTSDVVRLIKVNSSHLLGRVTDTRNRIEFQWQSEYGAMLFHMERFDQVVDYIRQQRHHHSENSVWAELEQTDRPR
ncbi:hypothetical protein BH09CHL1_BH09CHL1_07440 [soil metagenome]